MSQNSKMDQNPKNEHNPKMDQNPKVIQKWIIIQDGQKSRNASKFKIQKWIKNPKNGSKS